MCGRFTLTVPQDVFMAYIGQPDIPFHYKPRYNMAPGQFIPAVIMHMGKIRVGQLKWGLVPSWSTDQKSSFKMINTRAETLLEKPVWRKLFERKRCAIPADGFFEWQPQVGGKQPIRFTFRNRSIFSFAGLYDTWTDSQGNKTHTCTIITTEPNQLVAPIHNRMPAILTPEQEIIWLNRDQQNFAELHSLLKPFDALAMDAYPVTKRVGHVDYDCEECIQSLV